jgi:hypothetical protein
MKLITFVLGFFFLCSYYSQSNTGFIKWKKEGVQIIWNDSVNKLIEYQLKQDSVISYGEDEICLKKTMSVDEKRKLNKLKLEWKQSVESRFPYSKNSVGYSMNIVLLTDVKGFVKYAFLSGIKNRRIEIFEFEQYFLNFLIGQKIEFNTKNSLFSFSLRW